MGKITKKKITGLVLGFLTLAMVAGVGIFSFGLSTASAAPAAQVTPTQTAATVAKDTLRDKFVQAFASKLGVDQAKLNSAFTGAVSDTVDQAVKDGTLTQAQADKIKEEAKNGFTGQGFPGGRGGPGKGHDGGRGGMEAMKATTDAAAKALGLTTAELQTELKAGKSIADVAKAKSVDVATVKTAMLAAIKTDLDAKVKAGTLTQAQADTAYQMATTHIDDVINHVGKGPRK